MNQSPQPPIESLLQRARDGDAQAMRLLGERFLIGREAPYEPARGGGLIRMAAEKGDVEALAFMSVLAALGVGQVSNWREAGAYLRAAAKAGHKAAQGQVQALGRALEEPAALLAAPSPRWVLQAPRVAVVEQFISPSLCQWLIGRARPALARARVYDPGDGGRRALEMRTNSGMGFSFLDTDFILQLIHARIAAILGIPVLHQEASNILHYAPGETYRAHFDFLHPEEAQFAGQIQALGQRIATFLVYLNDDYAGGETEFSRAGFRFKGRAGDALFFFNVTPDGRPDPMTLHAGLPPTSGEKWLLSKWVRARPLPLV